MKKINIKGIIKKLLPYILIIAVGWFFFVRPQNHTSSVKKVSLQNKVINKNVSSSGIVKSVNQADLAFSTTGKVASIKVTEGDTVKKGMVLASVDYNSAYQTAKAYKDARDIAQRELDYYLMRKAENKDLYDGNDGYTVKLREMQEKVSQAEASYAAQLASLNNNVITAPFDGTVIDVTKEQGEVAAVGETVIKLADLSTLEFEIELDQEDYGSVREGMPVDIKLNSYDGHVFKGVVGKLPFFAQESSKNFKIDVVIESQKDKPVLLGMEGDAYIILESTNVEVPALTIDDISYDQEDKPYIWVVRNGKLAIQYIDIGLEGDIYTQVKTEVKDTIVVPAKDGIKLVEGYTASIIN